MWSALFLLVAQQSASGDCTTLERVPHEASGRAWIVRLCIRQVEPIGRIPLGMLYEYEQDGIDPFAAPVVEYGVVDATGRDLWIADHWLGSQPEPFLEDAPCDEERLWRVFEDYRFALRRVRPIDLRRCIVATTPRPGAWSKDGAFIALRDQQQQRDPRSAMPVELVDAESGVTILRVARVVDMDEGIIARPWPRGCLPLSFDELVADPYPMVCLGAGDERVELVAHVDFAERRLLRTEVPVRRPPDAKKSRDPFAPAPRTR